MPGGVPALRDRGVRDALDRFKREYGLDLEGDFLGLLTKEDAFSLALPSLRRPDDISLLFVAEVSNPGRMGVTLRRLGQALERQGLRLRRTEAGRTEVTVIEPPGTRQTAGYALRGAHLFLGYQARAVQAALQRTGGGSLAEDRDYIVTTSTLPDDRLGLFYLSLRRLILLLQDEPAVRGLLTPEEWRNRGALQGLAATSSFRDGVYRFSLVITIEGEQ